MSKDDRFLEIADRLDIVDLVSKLGRWLDEKGFNDVARSSELFLPDVVVHTPGGRAQGIAQICEMARANHSHDQTQHVHTNVLVALDGDSADVEANLIVTFVRDAAAPEIFSQVGTHYYFKVVRAEGKWRFAHIHDSLIWRRPENMTAKD